MKIKQVIAFLLLLGLPLWLGTSVAQMYEIVSDNTDPENTATGTWPEHPLAGNHGNNVIHYNQPGTGADYFRFVAPGVFVPGRYAVYARWAHHSSLAPNTRYEIWYDFGMNVSVRVNQLMNSSRWVLLDTVDIAAVIPVVRVYDDADGNVEADGLRYVRLGDSLTAPSSPIGDPEHDLPDGEPPAQGTEGVRGPIGDLEHEFPNDEP